MLKVTISPNPIENIIPQTVYRVESKKLSGLHATNDGKPNVSIVTIKKLTICLFTFNLNKILTHFLKNSLLNKLSRLGNLNGYIFHF